ncbi:unnamed protein product, partial [Ostreobium quekettii]
DLETRVPLTCNHDPMRNGLRTLRDGIVDYGPVEQLQKQWEADQDSGRYETLRNLYGSALPARMHIEKQLLERNQRLPPLASSNIASEAYFGKLEEFTIESFMGLPDQSVVTPTDTHSQMEAALGMGTKPCTRGIQ